MTTQQLASQSTVQAKPQKSGRLKNGVRAGSFVRIYREHEMRFARVLHVVSRPGIGPNVTVQYLDELEGGNQEKVFGNIVQPVTRGWLEDMKDRFEDIKDIFEPSVNGPISAQAEPAQNSGKLRNGVIVDSLVRVYENHQMRFARVKRVAKIPVPARANVMLQYLDGDREEDKVFGSIVQPITQGWVENLKSRLAELESQFQAHKATQAKAAHN
ncbi:MAG: hypothetical protein F6K04_00855 [Leptolyngbya sp. SIO4C5]|nr:hypothetical protein [Leptolyngbya sp. SIO4C5]